MNRYIGIDAHDKSCTAVVMDQKGQRVGHAVLETNGTAIRNFVEQVPGERWVAFEEGNLSAWLYELLVPIAREVVTFVPPKHDGTKDDLRDATRAAEGLRTNAFARTVYKPGRDLAALRCTVRAYQILRQDETRAMNRLKAVFRSRAVFCGEEIYDPEKRKEPLKRLPEAQRRLAEVLGKEVDELRKLLDEATKALKKARTSDALLLETLPGLGVVRAATIVAVVGAPERFRTSRQFWAYCGLGIVTRNSSDWEMNASGRWQRTTRPAQTCGLNRNRNAWLKEAFKGAAQTVVAAYPENALIEAHRRRVLGGQKPNLSMLTLARQLAAIALAMLKTKKEYDPNRYPHHQDTAR